MSKDLVLLVDDELPVLAALRRALRNEPLTLLATASAREALRLLETRAPVVLLSDYRMPEMDGVGLLEEAKRLAPDTIRMLLTGHADLQAVVAAINRGAVYRFLAKPWNDDELRIAVRQAVELSRLRAAALEAERNRVMAESLGAACHHMGQPLTALAADLWMLRRALAGADAAQLRLLAQCQAAAERLAEILHRMNAVNEYRTVPYLTESVDGAPPTRIVDLEPPSGRAAVEGGPP